MQTEQTIPPATSPSEKKHVVIVVHGIRTFADWFGRLRKLIHQRTPEAEVNELYFGYFSLFSLIFPWFRAAATKRYADILLHRLRELEGCRVDIVAHSFGTFVVATALERLKRESASPRSTPLVQNLILAGSVLKHEFP